MPYFDPSEIAQWCKGTWQSCQPMTLDGVSNDSRRLKQGSLYVALKGNRYDGHAFVEDAFSRGARGAMVCRDWVEPSATRQRPLLRVENTTQALRDAAAGYRQKIAPQIVAVSGSAGKSTVKEMTAQILATAMPTARTPGNWNNDIGLPLSLLTMEPSTRVGVFEAGVSHPGEMASLCQLLRPTWGVLTNVGPVHIEFFGSLDAIADEKANLLRSLPAGGVAVLNRDDSFFDVLRSRATGRVITVSLDAHADYICLRRNPSRGEAVIRETTSGEEAEISMPLKGEHNIVNAMMGIAVGRAFGVTWDRIAAALANYISLPLRWEEKMVNGVTVINDAYNANPMSMKAAIKAFAEEGIEGGKWLILGGMLELGDRENDEHLELGRYIGAGSWAGLITVGPLGRQIATGAKDAGCALERVFTCETNAEAAHTAMEHLKAGDAVFLKASRGIRLEEVAAILETGGNHD